MKSSFHRSRIINEYAHRVSKHKTRFYTRFGFDIIMGRREGIYFWDVNGKRYINLHCNGGVFNLGHRNPEVLLALQRGLSELDIGNHHLISGPRGLLARHLLQSMEPAWYRSLIQETIDTVVYAVSGGEAVDLAIKLARAYSGRSKVISLRGGYHGHTGLSLAAGDSRYRKPFGIELPGFLQIELTELPRVESFFGDDTAALLLETVPATLGMPVIDSQTMRHIRRACDKHNVTLILDEIQTGLGRTGECWGFQSYDLLPDIVLTGKGLSGGFYPIAATCFKKKYEAVFKNNPFLHISTFGGAEIACFAALRVVEISNSASFLRNVKDLARFFHAELHRIKDRYNRIVEIRQLGLFIGVVFENEATCVTMVKSLADHGVFAVYANNDRRVLQFLPPLITTIKQAQEIMEVFEDSLRALAKWKYRLIQRAVEWL